MNKQLREMGCKAGPHEVWSIAQYYMQHHPHQILGLLQVYEGHLLSLMGWLTGFAYALNIIEDNGMPLDLDEALHGYLPDEPFNLEAAIGEYIEKGGYGG